MALVEWKVSDGRIRTVAHAVVDGDLVTLCGEPASTTAAAVPIEQLSNAIACGPCMAIGHELALAVQQMHRGEE